MTLARGYRLGPYEIEAPAGAGGMGEVYRAKDTRLDRTVAIKVLPSHAAFNEDARTRFEREAKTISSLNHPNICTLHDVGNQDGIEYLVMEYLEGETLEERLEREKLDTAEALKIGIQIAAGLEAAHRKGLVHRDLKPGNIFLTREGAKLLDFGLAKLHAEAVTGVEDQTRTTPVTGAGAIVGTLQYMSPEQLEAKEADVRSDIFAFGATLYEMVSGHRAFAGDSKASLIGSIMKDTPRSLSEMLPASPPALDRLIKKCLEKDPDRRWQTAGDLRDELEWIASAGSQAGIARPVASRRRFRMRLAWVVATVAIAVAVFLGVERLTRETPVLHPVRFSISQPEGVARTEWPKISPDGRYLAFLGYDTAGNSQIWIRPLDSRQAYPLAGTMNTYRPFWSPDSKYLAFFDQSLQQIMKVPVFGGQPQLVCKTHGADGSWGKDDIILFDSYDGNSIGRVSAKGGEPRLAVAPDSSADETGVSWPEFLPDGRHFIYTATVSPTRGSDYAVVKAGSIEGDLNKTLGRVESQTIFCPPGFLLYVKEGYLVAQSFDPESYEITGDAVPLTDSIGFTSNSSFGMNASVSATGTLVSQAGSVGGVQRLTWVDREGNTLDTIGRSADYRGLEISPDGRRVAYTVFDQKTMFAEIEVLDIQTGSFSRVTPGNSFNLFPRWSPDNLAFVYGSTVDNEPLSFNYYALNGATEFIMRLDGDKKSAVPVEWTGSQNLRYFEYPISSTLLDDDVVYYLINIDITDTTRVDTIFGVTGPKVPFEFSPDGRYLVAGDYWGFDAGLYVYDTEEPEHRWRLPTRGFQARWSPVGGEIFFFNGDDFMSLDVDLSNGFQFGTPQTLFTRRHLGMSELRGVIWGYDVGVDAQRFLFVTPMADEERSGDIDVVLNWHAGLE
jgi:serine/threonine protein kinase